MPEDETTRPEKPPKGITGPVADNELSETEQTKAERPEK